MDHTTFLIAANAVIWLGVGGYLAWLAAGQKRLQDRLTQLEQLSRDDDDRLR